MVLSTMMQGENDLVMAKRMFLPLSERMLEKMKNDGSFDCHADILLYLMILKRQDKYSDALDVLNKREFLDRINEMDYNRDYSDEILDLQSSLDDWPGMLQTAQDMLQSDHDNWSAWKTLMEHAFRCESDDGNKFSVTRVGQLCSLIEQFVKQSPKARGPHLARIDFCANLVRREIPHPSSEESLCMDIIKHYIEEFGGKPICALDIAYAIPLLLKDEKNRTSFLEALLKDFCKKSASLPPDDVEGTQLEVCAYRVTRASGVPIDLVDVVSSYQLHAATLPPQVNGVAEGSAISKDMCPPDGLLLLAVSELLDPVIKPPSSGHALGQLLLAAYWLAQIGLMHSPANHFMRLRLASILAPGGGLACVERQLQELKSMDLKQILLVSLGHLVVTPGPHLTIWSGHESQSASHAGSPQEGDSTLADFYHMLINKTQFMQREAEDWLVGAYRQQAYTQVREFTQFINQLKHADGLLLARAELIYDRVIVRSNSFDEALEKMGGASAELTAIRQLLDKIVDCRDFGVVPNFTSHEQNPDNQIQSFDHLRTWVKLRLDVVDLFGACSKLVMRAVPCIDQLGSGELSAELRQDLRNLVQTIDESTASLMSRVKSLDFIEPLCGSNFKYTDLLLTPETIFLCPPPLPKTAMMSFYFTGPFHLTLVAGLELLKHLTGLLDTNPDQKPNVEDCSALQRFAEPLLKFVGGAPDLPVLPSPPSDSDALPDWLNPSAVLIGLGVAVETLSMAVLFISAAAAMLRPRRLIHQPLSKRSKKNKKKQQCIEDKSETKIACPVISYVDRVAGSLCDIAFPRVELAATQMQQLAESWTQWARSCGSAAFTATALNTAKTALTRLPEENKAFPWYPTCETASPTIYAEMAGSLASGFGGLAELCRRKLVALAAAHEEVRCFTSLKTPGNEE
uniref:Ribonuclease P/MRP protein subunit POP5 n=1 Tax=Mesocestoides corti TaxID=53468 RepID=A0A5K3EW86_MESCO